MRESNKIRSSELSRRDYARVMAGVGAAALAGCPGDGDGGTATEGGNGTDEGNGDTDEQSNGSSEAVTDTVRVGVNNTADQFNLNPWVGEDNTTGDRFLMELNAASLVDSTDIALSGTTVPTPHKPDHDEVEIMTWIEDYSVDPPFDWRQSYDDRATYWNGDPYDAEALVTHTNVTWFRDGNKFVEGATFNEEAEDQWTRHVWNDKGEAENQDENPAARQVLEADATAELFNPPLHPDFTTEYLERYQQASTEEESTQINDDLSGDRISLERMADEGWGSGMYELRSGDDIGSERATLHLRDDSADAPHPNAEHTNVSQVDMMWASQDRRQVLQTNGEIDLDDGAITEQSSPNRGSLPDHMQEITRFYSPTTGNQFLMNWHNPHLQNLWVRRAIVEAVDWNLVTSNGWGEEGARVLQHDTFLMDTEAESTFSEEFLGNLHTYSREQNQDQADEYMQRAGYSVQGGQWVDPDGNTATIELMGQSGDGAHVDAGSTIQAQLSDWGLGVDFTSPDFSTWSNALNPSENGLDFDTSIFWSDTATVFGKYNDRGAWWGEALLGGSPTACSVFELTEDDDRDTQNKPVVVQLPEEVGSIEAPDQAGINPDLENGREVNMFEVVQRIRSPDITEEELTELYQTCAQYYNFYLPDFVFNQSLAGNWGNVRDFDWPDPDHESLNYGRNLSVADGVVMTGLVQASTDEDFEPPN